MTFVASTLDHNTGASVSTITSASVSPTGSSLLVLWASAWDGSTSGPTVSSVSGFGAWNFQGHCGPSNKGDLSCWACQLGASPGSATVAITWGASGAGVAYDLQQVTGSAYPITTNSSTGSGTSATTTFATAQSGSSIFLCAAYAALGHTATLTQTPAETPTAWTELTDQTISSAAAGGVGMETQVSPSASELGAVSTLSATHGWGMLGLEIGSYIPPPAMGFFAAL